MLLWLVLKTEVMREPQSPQITIDDPSLPEMALILSSQGREGFSGKGQNSDTSAPPPWLLSLPTLCSS